MYIYDAFDRRLLAERVTEFRDQVARRLSGELTEEEFKPLRLMNGVYLQLHAYMLRIAIPYGTLSTLQLRKLAEIARRHRAKPPQIALAWLLRRSPVMLPIPGTSSTEHFEENLAATRIQLSDDEVTTLTNPAST